MKYLAGSALQKVLAAIVAAFMSFSTLTPAISNIKSNQKPTGIVQTVKKVDGKIVAVTPEVKATEETTAPEAQEEETAVPDVQEEEVAAPEAQEEETAVPDVQEEEVAAPEVHEEEATAPEADEAIAEWDISDSEQDDVKMYYYEDDSFLDTVVGAVRALFVPMTAFAAEEEEYTGGTLYVDGTGSTESFVFLNLIKDYKAFARGYEDWAEDNGYRENELYVSREFINEKGEIIGEEISPAEAHTLSKFDGKINYEYMIRNYFPSYLVDMVTSVDNFWETYGFIAPERIIVDGDIDTLNFASFAFLSSVRELEITGTVENIGDAAFAGTSISELVIPEGTVTIGDTAFANCHQLAVVTLPAGLQEIGKWNFTEMPVGSVIYVPDMAVAFLLIDREDVMNAASVDGNAQQLTENYDSSRTEILLAQ